MNDELQIGDWHHSPLHIFAPNTLYMITACTLYKQPIFDSPTKLELLQDILFEAVQVYERELQTWALFASHTRFITRSPEDGASLKRLIQRLHSQSARLVNQIDSTPGWRVWSRLRNNPPSALRDGLKVMLWWRCMKKWSHFHMIV